MPNCYLSGDIGARRALMTSQIFPGLSPHEENPTPPRKEDNVRRSRPPRRKTFSSLRRRRRAKQLPASPAEQEILDTIKEGIERFILKNATVEEFLKMIRTLSAKENVYSHQLTKSVIARIVKPAIRKRNLRRTKTSNHTKSLME